MTAAVVQADARALPLPDASVDLIVTSPPYYALRDYQDGAASLAGQIGAEESPREYIAALLKCTREWARVLKPEGSIFVNLGDKYANRTRGAWRGSSDGYTWRAESPRYTRPKDVPEKSLMLLPELYRVGAVYDLGLIARAVVIWSKTNGLPESVTDRVRRSHEDWVHLTLQPRYYSAVDEIRQPHQMRPQRRPNGHQQRQKLGVLPAQTYSTSQRNEKGVDGHPLGALPGSVWEIPTQALKVPDRIAHARCCGGRKREGCEEGLEHFAAFPPALPMRIIAGWSPPGICTACGEGRRPVADRTPMKWRESPTINGRRNGTSYKPASGTMLSPAETRITGYACACPTADAPTRPAVVVDPFGGTGTTALAARALGRRGVSFELSADYCRLAQWRTDDPSELARVLGKPKPAPVAPGQGDLFEGWSA